MIEATVEARNTSGSEKLLVSLSRKRSNAFSIQSKNAAQKGSAKRMMRPGPGWASGLTANQASRLARRIA